MELNRLFDLVKETQDHAAVEAVFGPSIQVGERTVIPIGRVIYGFGLGFGQGTTHPAIAVEHLESGEADVAEDTNAGGGVGGALSVQPVAVLEVTPEATVITPVVDQGKIVRTVTFVVAWSVFWLARALVKIIGQR